MITCPCGATAYNRDELVSEIDPRDPTFGANAALWYSLLGPEDYYCPDEDDVLTDAEVRRAKAFKAKREATRLEQVPRWAILAGWLSYLLVVGVFIIYALQAVFG